MRCNGCRVLWKGCTEACVLRLCLQWIESAEARGHATVFVAKFFDRAGLMSFISAVPERPPRRTINPVNGTVGVMWAGNWDLCKAAVGTVLRRGTLRPLPDLDVSAPGGAAEAGPEGPLYERPLIKAVRFSSPKQGKDTLATEAGSPACDLDLCLSPRSPAGAI